MSEQQGVHHRQLADSPTSNQQIERQRSAEAAAGLSSIFADRPPSVDAFLASKYRVQLYRVIRAYEENVPLTAEELDNASKLLFNFLLEKETNQRILLYLPLSLLKSLIDHANSAEARSLPLLFSDGFHSLLQHDAYTTQLCCELVPRLLELKLLDSTTFTIQDLEKILKSPSVDACKAGLNLIPVLIQVGILNSDNFAVSTLIETLESDDFLRTWNQSGAVIEALITAKILSIDEFNSSLSSKTQSVVRCFSRAVPKLVHDSVFSKDDFPASWFAKQLSSFAILRSEATSMLPKLIEDEIVSVTVWEQLMQSTDTFARADAIKIIPALLKRKILPNANFPAQALHKMFAEIIATPSDLPDEEQTILNTVLLIMPDLISQGFMTGENVPLAEWFSLIDLQQHSGRSYTVLTSLEPLLKQGVLTKENFPYAKMEVLFETILHTKDSTLYVIAGDFFGTLVKNGIYGVQDFKKLMSVCPEGAAHFFEKIASQLLESNAINARDIPEIMRTVRPRVRDMLSKLSLKMFQTGVFTHQDLKLLGFRNPETHLAQGVFQNFQAREYKRSLKIIKHIVLELSQKYPGISQAFLDVGSGGKGYWTTGSDLDLTFFVTSDGVGNFERFRNELAQRASVIGITVDGFHSVRLDMNGSINVALTETDSLANLWSSPLIGDSNTVGSLRKNLLEKIQKYCPAKIPELRTEIESQVIEGYHHQRKIMRPTQHAEVFSFDNDSFRKKACLLYLGKATL